jgi:hypothetical protein
VIDVDTDNTATKTVRVPSEVRETLRETMLGETMDTTIATLSQVWERRKEAPVWKFDCSETADTTVTVSQDTHRQLSVLKDRMNVDTLGSVVTILVESFLLRKEKWG